MRTINESDYRPYQIAARDAVFNDFENGIESALVVMPTGVGKTIAAGMCAENAARMGKKTLFVAHREILVTQAFRTISRFGLDVAVEMGLQDARKHAATFGAPDVVVGSVQSLQDDRLMRWPQAAFDYIIIDECHRANADSYTKMLNWFSGAKIIGITATPKRGDERNLGARFQKKSYEYRIRNAIQDGWLVPIRTRTCSVPIDLRGVKMSGGDFAIGELEDRLSPDLEKMARAFAKEIGERPGVAFLPDCGSAAMFAHILTEIGVPALYVAGTGGKFGISKADRMANLAAYERGECQVLTCNELLVEGWDAPRTEAVGILRPTLQSYRYSQMAGRGTRPSPATGKTDLLVIDFDWQTDPDVKDLCSSVDIFDDGSLDSEVYAVARMMAREKGMNADADPEEMVDEAARIVRIRQTFRIRLTGKEAQYAAIEHDPVGVSKILDIKLNRKYDLDKRGDNPATEAQVYKLRSLGVTAANGLSKWGASKMIGKLMKRQESGQSSATQVQALMASGVDGALARGMSFDQARTAITQIDAYNRSGAGKTEPQKMLF